MKESEVTDIMIYNLYVSPELSVKVKKLQTTLTYKCGPWFMIKKDEEMLKTWDRNIFKKAYGPVLTQRASGIRYRRRMDQY